ncbi:Ankyrin_repeat protein 1 [Hexamita inflata]|uniref:Ankyrin repeat protein 1 n=1 Tax=Hexamita inflata TaxID=28002 RepID=A0AA86R0T9_9EUKA|nr:Ankyrin repeat protein 1 [Hexamita inflata]CAI9967553.1 Ankyrin repeat protein 1 [Hexamita inflata]
MSWRKISPDQWFDAILQNDMSTVTKYLTRMKKTVDKRKLSAGTQIIPGFCGIHYAAMYGMFEMFRLLLDNEFMCLTKMTTHIESSKTAYKFSLPGNSTFVHILCCTTNNKSRQLLSYFIEQLQNKENEFKYQKLIGVQNSLGLNATHVSLLTGKLGPLIPSTATLSQLPQHSSIQQRVTEITKTLDENQIWWANPLVLQRELYQKTEDELTTVMIACLFGRSEFIAMICYLFTLDPFQLHGIDVSKMTEQNKKQVEKQLDETVKNLRWQRKILGNLIMEKEKEGYTAQHALDDKLEIWEYGGERMPREYCRQFLNEIEKIIKKNM